MNNILKAREERHQHIEQLMKEYPYKTVVVLKKNVAGKEKNIKYMKFIIHMFDAFIRDMFLNHIITDDTVPSLDGDYVYYIVDIDGNIVKEKTIVLEEENQLGRLVDIDVYNQKSITRSDLQCEMRQCIICNNYAHICAREQSHSKEEIHGKVREMINNYLLQHISMSVVKSIYTELDMYPKFGLVSSHDSGAHSDMDMETFVRSTFSIQPFIKEYIQYALDEKDDPQALKEIGIRAENAMFETTNGVNTQKGLIFALGVFLPALVKTILQNEDATFLSNEIKEISNVIVGNYFQQISNKDDFSHGDIVYLKYGLRGIRGEALNGFKVLFDIPSFSELEIAYRYHEYLIHLMSKVNDTTIVYRSNLKTLKTVQETMRFYIKDGGYKNNIKEIAALSDAYKVQRISPGGSADLLVLKIIYEQEKYLLKNYDWKITED